MAKRSGRDHAAVLIRKAASDEALLREAVHNERIPVDVFGFHAQQAVEKLLKAVLAAHEIDYGLTHDLDRLIQLIGEHDIRQIPDLSSVDVLTPWAVGFRYDEPPESTQLDRPGVLALVGRVREWAVELVAGA